ERAAESRDSNAATPQMAFEAETPPGAERATNQRRSTREPLVTVDGTFDSSRPDMLAVPQGSHLDLVKAGGRPSTQTERAGKTGYAGPVEAPILSAEAPAAAASRAPRPEKTYAAEFEPVRMDRRPNPYADVP